mmetsp:Transcript_1039/g.3494  ORF Transcript_1039/g.3494 Transcript_1039/m.3494 type:complete len:142 (-) Transcript_1039:29-454(-)
MVGSRLLPPPLSKSLEVSPPPSRRGACEMIRSQLLPPPLCIHLLRRLDGVRVRWSALGCCLRSSRGISSAVPTGVRVSWSAVSCCLRLSRGISSAVPTAGGGHRLLTPASASLEATPPPSQRRGCEEVSSQLLLCLSPGGS